MDDQKTRRLDDPTADDSCPKCGGLMKASTLVTTGALGIQAKEGRGRLWDVSSLEAKVCGHCGYTELYATKPEKL
ncbi:MAG TPA: hypothetical protein VFM49_06245 [Chloroflexia bacterium]|jgi:predicted nucleic-acid-binding Zn-ribbon protein|nr:hypothetical protein [Chloroflexia bacterium]